MKPLLKLIVLFITSFATISSAALPEEQAKQAVGSKLNLSFVDINDLDSLVTVDACASVTEVKLSGIITLEDIPQLSQIMMRFLHVQSLNINLLCNDLLKWHHPNYLKQTDALFNSIMQKSVFNKEFDQHTNQHTIRGFVKSLFLAQESSLQDFCIGITQITTSSNPEESAGVNLTEKLEVLSVIRGENQKLKNMIYDVSRLLTVCKPVGSARRCDISELSPSPERYMFEANED